MKIGLFTHVYSPMINGVAISVKTLGDELKRNGNEVFIIDNNYNGFYNSFNETHFEVISLPIFYQNLRTPILYNQELFHKLDSLNLDIIHSHSDFGIGILARMYACKKGIPLIQTYHCNYIEYAKENFGIIPSKIATLPVGTYTSFLYKTANKFIVPSKYCYDQLVCDFKIKGNIDIIPNGIDLSSFKEKKNIEIKYLKNKYHISNNDFVLLSLSRLSKEKRIDDIIALMAYLKSYQHIKLLIVGGGPDEDNLKKICNKLNSPNIIFAGMVNHDSIVNYYKIADAFVSNSVDETQGLTVIESLAASVPTLVCDIPLYDNLIINDYNGYKYKDLLDLKKYILYLYKNKEKLLLMQKNAPIIVDQFDIKNTTNKVSQIYEEEIFKRKQLIKIY